MALTNPDYSSFKTLAQYANQLAYLKKQYEAGNKEWAAKQAELLRWQAVLNGFDLKVLEKEAVIKYGGDPEKIDWANFEKTTNAPFVAAVTLANLKKQYMNGEISQTIAHEQAQKVRLNAAYNDIDLTLLEQRAGQYADPNHKEPSADYVKTSMPDIKEAQYAAKLMKNGEYWNRIQNDPKLTDAQKKWYQNQVHNESQNLRADALKDGLNLWDIEKLYTPFVTGHAWNQQDYETAKKYIDPLYKAAGKDPSGVQIPNFTTGGTTNDYAFKKPIVKRTMFGETFSGADMVVFFAFPGHMPIEIGVATTVSVTSYREKKQFRTIGRITPRGITKGPRTVSGKIIFTVIKEHIVETLKTTIPYLADYDTLKFDELPSFDIMVSMGNEYGGAATMIINGVTTVDEQKTLSIEELFTENIFTYLARDYQPLRETKKSKWAKYDPQEWYSYKLREKGSELIGKFQIDDLILSENAKNLASSLPGVGFGEEWTKLSADDIARTYYNQLTNDEDAKMIAAAEKTVHARKIFIQVFSKQTGKVVTMGKLSVKFDNQAYNDPSRPWDSGKPDGVMSSYTEEDNFDFSLATPANGKNYYGLLILTDEPLSAGMTFSIGYSGYKGVAGQPTFIYKNEKGKTADGEFTYIKVVVEQQEDQSLYLLKSDDSDHNITCFYESYRKWGPLPKLENLTLNTYKQAIQKSVDGWEWVSCEVMKGNNMAKDIEVTFSWAVLWDFMPGGNEQFAKKEAVGNDRSLAALQYYFNKDKEVKKTNAYGQVSIRMKDLVLWKGANDKDKDGFKDRIYFSDLPDGAIVRVHAQISNGQYVQWMLRKVSKLTDL